MAARRRKNGKEKGWSYSAGARGENRVRVYERPGLGIWTDFRDESGKRVRHPLGITDREQAKAKADDIAAKFRRAAKRQPNELTLAVLFETYEREVTGAKGDSSQEHDRRAFEMFRRFFGAARRPITFSRRDWDAYITARRSGALAPLGVEGPKGVRDRAIQHDLATLNAVLNWAVLAGDGCGGYLLERNPLKGLRLPREESPRRPVLTLAQYEAVRREAAKISARHELFVVLCWETGHRGASVRHLRWSDVDLESGRVMWRAEYDKIGREHRNPLSDEAAAALKREMARVKVIGDRWIFPATRTPLEPISRRYLARLFGILADRAGLPKGERYGWHSCRRGFANRLRKVPLRDLQDLGGWTTATTLLTCYQQPDEAAQREALQTHTPAPASQAEGGRA